MNDPVDVLIIGAGASGAAFAWSLADTRMRILCLEQGDWMNPSDYPSTRRDWEVRADRDFSPNPNVRRRPEDYPINNDDSPISVAQLQRRRRQHHPVRRALSAPASVGLPGPHPGRRRRRLADRLRRRSNRTTRSTTARWGWPAWPATRPIRRTQPPLPPVPLGLAGETMARGFNALGWHWWPSDTAIATRELRGPRPVREPGAVQDRLRAGRQGQRRHHLLAGGAARRRAAAHALPRARDPGRRQGHGHRRRLLRRARASSSCSAPRWSCWPATAWARRGCCSTPSRRAFPTAWRTAPGLVGKNLMFHPWGWCAACSTNRSIRSAARTPCCILSQQFYETDRSRGFVRGYNLQVTRGFGPGRDRAHRARPRRHSVGPGSPRGVRPPFRPHDRRGRSAARTCPRNATRSRWTRR